jgi:hypothetical protein
MCIVVDLRITTNCKEGSQSRRRQCSGRQQSEVRQGECQGHHRGRRAGHALRGGTWELGRAPCLLGQNAGRAGVPADQEPWRGRRAFDGQRACRRDTKQGSSQGIGARATSEATRDGHEAVVAEHSTGEGGEGRPKRPTGGKARPGITVWRRELRETRRCHQPYQ